MFFAQKRGKLFGVPTGAHPLPWMGHDAPTTARKVGLLLRGGQYFLSKRKKVPKKAGGTATTGKSLLLPILPAGLATSRVIKLDSYPQRLCALLCSPISAVKMGGPFSLRCLSPLVSPAGGAGQTQMAVLGIVSCYVGGLAASMGRPVFQFAVGVNHI